MWKLLLEVSEWPIYPKRSGNACCLFWISWKQKTEMMTRHSWRSTKSKMPWMRKSMVWYGSDMKRPSMWRCGRISLFSRKIRIRKSRQRRENRTISFSKGIICIVWSCWKRRIGEKSTLSTSTHRTIQWKMDLHTQTKRLMVMICFVTANGFLLCIDGLLLPKGSCLIKGLYSLV